MPRVDVSCGVSSLRDDLKRLVKLSKLRVKVELGTTNGETCEMTRFVDQMGKWYGVGGNRREWNCFCFVGIIIVKHQRCDETNQLTYILLNCT